MFKKLMKVAAVVLAGTMLLTAAGCGPKYKNVSKIKETKKIVLGTSADYPPYEFHKEVGGKDTIVGFDIEIAKEVAKDLGVELEIKDMGFDGLLAALKTGKVDFVISGMTPTEERAKEVDFSKIYYMAKQGVIVRAEDKGKIKTVADLKGKKVGAQQGSIQEDIAKEQMKDSELKTLQNVADLVLELKNKKVDAVVMELPVANAYILQNTELTVSEVKVEDETGGSAVGITKGNKELVDAINKTIDRLNSSKSIDKFVDDASKSSISK